MANYEIIIPENAQVPAYALLDAGGSAAQANEDAMFGISSGAPPRIKLSGKSFVLVNENGDQTPYPPAKLKAGPDGNLYLPVVVLKVKRALSKAFYLNAYNPNDEDRAAPDCMSTDGERPDAGVFSPQSEICATCPQNVYGSGTDQNGNPTAGKACQDTKRMAVVVPNFGVYELKLPPKSFKNWNQYIRELNKRNFRVDASFTLVGFDLTSEFPILQFQFGSFVPEAYLPKLAELINSPEVDAIVNPMGMMSAAPKAIAAPPVQQQVVDTSAEDEAKTKAEAAAKKKAEAAKKKAEADAKAKAAAQAAPVEMDLGLGDPAPATVSAAPSDDELAAALGL